MKLEHFEEKGLKVFLAGASFNFRQAKLQEEAFCQQINLALKSGGFPEGTLYSGKQVHGDRIEYCGGQNGQGEAFGRSFMDTDGLITDKSEVILMTKFADCTPILLYDPVKKAQCLVHSGWLGSAKEIGRKAVQSMQAHFNSQLKDLMAMVGPSIGQVDYQVDEVVYQAFEKRTDRMNYFKPDPHEAGKYYLDMTQANVCLLLDAGLKESQIYADTRSTFSSSQLHSARREGTNYQLNAIFSMIQA